MQSISMLFAGAALASLAYATTAAADVPPDLVVGPARVLPYRPNPSVFTEPMIEVPIQIKSAWPLDAMAWCVDGVQLQYGDGGIVGTDWSSKGDQWLFRLTLGNQVPPGDHTLTTIWAFDNSSGVSTCTGSNSPIAVMWPGNVFVPSASTGRYGKPSTVKGFLTYGPPGGSECSDRCSPLQGANPYAWRVKVGKKAWSPIYEATTRADGTFTVTTPALRETSQVQVRLLPTPFVYNASGNVWRTQTIGVKKPGSDTPSGHPSGTPGLSAKDAHFMAALRKGSPVFGGLPASDLIANAKLKCSLLRQGASIASIYQSNVALGLTPDQALLLLKATIANYCPEIS